MSDPLIRDLFPETLLVSIEGDRTTATSLKLAEHFHKAHRNVMRDIEKLKADYAEAGLNALNFERVEYTDRKGETRFMCVMDRKAFSVLAMRFTGKKALVWRDDFYNAFEAMERALHAQSERRAAALARVRPHWITIEEADRDGLTRAEIIARTGHKSAASVTANRARMRAVGLPCRPRPGSAEAVRRRYRKLRQAAALQETLK